jgi:D-glycero-D-manno-heptose 1,7-bisphosphate phosphatase
VSARRHAAFLDRDGVLNELVVDAHNGRGESPLRVADVHLTAGAAQAAIALRAAGFVLVCVTNQPGAAKGQTSVATLTAIQWRVGELLAEQRAQLDDWRMCMHHPDGVVAGLSGGCACRKPAPGMLLEAAYELELDLARSWMIGDTDADVAAGKAAGCRTALVANPASAHKRLGGREVDVLAPSVEDAVARLLTVGGPR